MGEGELLLWLCIRWRQQTKRLCGSQLWPLDAGCNAFMVLHPTLLAPGHSQNLHGMMGRDEHPRPPAHHETCSRLDAHHLWCIPSLVHSPAAAMNAAWALVSVTH